VPVALNLYKIREQKDAAGNFFRSLQKQKPNYQGFWISAPDGKLIAAFQNFKDHKTWTQEVIETLDGAIKDFGAVEPRKVKATDPLPNRGTGVQADGRLCLSVYFCILYNGKREAPPSIDSILLTPAELGQLAPPKLEAGAESTVPEAVARKFCRAISASSDTSHMPGPEDVTKVEMRARVESIQDGAARIRLTGSWEAVKVEGYDPKKRPTYSTSFGDGLLVVDLKAREPASLLMVFRGIWKNVTPYDAPQTSAAVVEWKRAAP
jgi:hypothetical protein